MVLGGPEELGDIRDCGAKRIGLDIDIFGETAHFCFSVARRQARLSDAAVLAQSLATELAMAVLKRLEKEGEFVLCRKGCSVCCGYLVPMAVPEVFRFRDAVLALPAKQGEDVLRRCLKTAERILAGGFEGLDPTGPAGADGQIDINRLARWYGGLGLRCPLVADGLCTLYPQRPVACREHIVTDSALARNVNRTSESHAVGMPVNIVQVLGQLAAELEGADIEAVMLPLALPWAEENIERSQRRWSAVPMVERFVELLEAGVCKDAVVQYTPTCCAGKA